MIKVDVCGVDGPCGHGSIPIVLGRCPACGNNILGLHGQVVQCDNPVCPDRLAAYKVLHLDHRHVLDQSDNGWSIEHPAACRLDGKRLLDCPVHALVGDAGLALTERGRYWVELDDDSPWGFTTTPVEATDD